MKLNLLLGFGFSFLLGLLITSCQHDPVEPTAFCDTVSPTYTSDIKTIVDASCAYAGCHSSGAGIGDFTTFSGMESRLSNNKIKERVIDMKDDITIGMPPNYATAGPTDLTNDEIALFECWLNAGFPE